MRVAFARSYCFPISAAVPALESPAIPRPRPEGPPGDFSAAGETLRAPHLPGPLYLRRTFGTAFGFRTRSASFFFFGADLTAPASSSLNLALIFLIKTRALGRNVGSIFEEEAGDAAEVEAGEEVVDFFFMGDESDPAMDQLFALWLPAF